VLLAACLVLFGAACSVPQSPETASEEADPTAAPAEITPAEVEVFGVRLFSGDNGYEVEGQIQNNSSSFTLTEFQFQMAMQDCLPSGVCEILAEDVSTIAADVPAGESAPFTARPNFSSMPAPQGKLGWHYAVVATTGATP
jgi:hypothetical protein